ncbi:GNAT family N-acetyltransferase [Streptococcus ovuberis]|uniref:GNAT family N-acetyltransferase n=1 Tax=Streptococcus ovuberis TaxID=1936207 RepID=A0A7X6S2A3_9STRE|nr:GNAT family protein [Streptococcus ovuberis]NKZ21185.1 GNAT family N-acetyltransferase [Streptococcus ovuberis]
MPQITITPLTLDHIDTIRQIGFTQDKPKWADFNAPYFEEYKPCQTVEELLADDPSLTNPDKTWGIFVDGQVVGTLGRYWENKATRWLEIGLIIYDENLWSAGIGSAALSQWIEKCFDDFPEIERVGLTSWSGNPGMMKLATKLGMTQEACIRKVRYWQGIYYDSVKYGVLREEWFSER